MINKSLVSVKLTNTIL